MASFYIPLTGLNADSKALNTIANNLANMNTTGFKSQATSFSDLLYQQIGTTGSGDAIQVGSGVQVAANRTDFSGGSISSTGISTNAAINGSGFFVLDQNGGQLYTRNGNFQLGSDGVLETSNGLPVMGYGATNGVIDTGGSLADITIPAGQVMKPSATTTFGLTQNLDSSGAVGTSTPGQVKVYDSLGNSYEASVTFTKTGTNSWSYSISMPDSLLASPASAPAATLMPVTSAAGTAATVTIAAAATAPSAAPFTATVTPSSSISGTDTTYSYNFGTGGTVDPTTSLTIGGVPVTVAANESVSALQAQINGLGIVGVTANVAGNVLSITAPTATAMGGSVVGALSGTTSNFTFNTGGTVDPATNLTITGQTATGATATITAPAITTGESMATYASDLTNALSAAGITNVTVTANATPGQLSIVGADVTTSGGVSQDLPGTTTNFNFGANATVDPGSNLTITGQTASGATVTTALPTFSGSPETVAQYAADLTTALNTAGITGVTVSSTGGQLSIVGANSSVAGSVNQDLMATTIHYSFGSSGGTLATVDPSTNLTITGQTPSGSTATISAPRVIAGETLAQYATALTNALATAGITGVQVSSTAGGQLSIVGSNISTSGSVIQAPVASGAATGTLTFDSGGNLASPATDVSNISFSGLSDGAATMNLTWNLFGANGNSILTQTATESTTSGTNQNGYASGQYQDFTIGSDGTVSASYSNGQTQNVGQLAIATVSNEQGLVAVGSSDYQATTASGSPSVGTAGSGGRGTIEGSSLEASNVNISAEFSNLIIAQRAFQANSKAVTTFDSVTQDTINMIR